MRCGQCDKTTKVSFDPLPAKVKCSIDNQFHEMSEQCKIEFVSLKHGHWIRNDNGTCSCSECQSWVPNEQYYYARYCLHCGAKMDLPEPIIYPQVEGITPTVVKTDEVTE